MNSIRIPRRQFLRHASLLAGASVTGLAAEGGGLEIPVIDTHTHFFDPTRGQGVPWPPKGETVLYKPHYPPQFAALAAPQGVVGTVVVEASPWLEDNQWILDQARDNPIIVGFIGHLDPGQPEFAVNLKRFSANPLFRGIRLNATALTKGLGQARFEEDLHRLEDGGLTVDLLGGAAMLPDAVRLAQLTPKLRIIIDHLPFKTWDDKPAEMFVALAQLAAAGPNIHVKISEVVRRKDGRVVEEPAFYKSSLDTLWGVFGPDRAIYGSNWPVSNLMAPYASVYRVVADYFRTKDRIEAEKFFWRNSLKVYAWQPRGAAAALK